MPSIREQILAALPARLETVPDATVKREAPLPETVPAGGRSSCATAIPATRWFCFLRSPTCGNTRPRSRILQRGQDDDSAALDTLLMAVGAALSPDRSLGGLAEGLDWGAPKTSGLAIDGAAALRGATVPVTIHYASADPLLGQGRDAQDPFYEAIKDEGDIGVPLDVRALGFWLEGLFGVP